MKRICFFSVFMFLLLASPAAAQYEWDFSGYVVDFPVYSVVPTTLAQEAELSEQQIGNLMRLRLRPRLFMWEGASLGLEYELDAEYQSGSFSIGEDRDRTNRQYFDLKWHLHSGDHFQVLHFIDRLYFRQNWAWGSAIMGRQRIAWGTGRIWNPTDLFSPINPANYAKIEKDGTDAVALKFYLGDFTDLALVYNPMPGPDSSNMGLRFRTNAEEFDYSVMGGFFDRRYVGGADFAGNFFDAGVRGEGIYSVRADSTNDTFIKFVLGADYQLTGNLYCLIEYQFNGEGSLEPAEEDLQKLLKGEILNLKRNYLFFSANYLLYALVNGTFSVNQSLDDGSGFVSVAVAWSSSDNSSVSLGGLLPYGAELTEYWIYPGSVYLKGEFYF